MHALHTVNLSQGRASGSGSNELQAKERAEEEQCLPDGLGGQAVFSQST
jgi:hypothetical protein